MSDQPPVVTPLAEGLSSRTFPASLHEDGTPDAASAAFTRAVEHGFHLPWQSEEQLARSVPTFVEDGQQLTGVYVDSGFAALEPWGEAFESYGFGAGHPVGTFIDYDKTLNAGGAEPVPARLITGVTVNPSFRRRGVLKHMMTSRLAAAVEDGAAVAALTATEGGIYGRFGFAPATREQEVHLNVTAAGEGFALRGAPSGQVLPADPSRLEGLLQEIFAQFHARSRGSVGRQPIYWKAGTARWDPEEITRWNRKLRTVVHVTEEGELGGFAAFTHEGRDVEPPTLRVRDLIAVDSVSRAELIRHLAQMDLVQRIIIPQAPVQDAFAHMLVNPRAADVKSVGDHLWVRVLDPVAALQGRGWGADGDLTLSLTDPLGISSGTFALSIRGGAAQVSRADRGSAEQAQHVTMDVETLGALYLGDVSVLTMRDAGRVAAVGEVAWDALAATVDLPGAPHCATHF